ncbi:ATP-binding protein [Poseidonocella sp. HB161398]|uniref:ATP-binding protein n=1 Tax=Poseidonocella sp. HB161398 TaxID=2320855 RepID=UPI001F102912|nr:ATP-binding protein [Poseidonocella sp. HB161398]
MSATSLEMPGPLRQACARVRGGAFPVLAAGIGLLLLTGWLYPHPRWVLAATAAATLCALALGVLLLAAQQARINAEVFETMRRMLAWDPVPVYTTDAAGRILWSNEEARLQSPAPPAGPISGLLCEIVADHAKFTADLQARAATHGHARETRAALGRIVHVSVLKGADGTFLWRIEEVAPQEEAGLDTLDIPMMRVSGSGLVVAANRAMQGLLHRQVSRLDQVFGSLPLVSGAVHLVQTGNGEVPMQVYFNDTKIGKDVYLVPAASAAVSDDARLFETLPVPLLKLDSKGEIVLANRGARELLEDPIPPGRRLSELVSGLGRSVTEWLEDATEGRGLNRSEFLQVTKQTKDVFVQVTLKPLPEHEEADLVAVLNDATELKTLEAQFVQSQKMQAIGQLAGGVAHDFNNLLTAISGHCDLLLLRHDQGDPEYGDLVQIHQNTNRAASLVGQLLAFSRKQTLQPEMVDLRDTLSELTHLLNRLVGEKITLQLRHDPRLSPIRADKRQLEQVIMNLVVNSRDAMPEGGEIIIETQAQTLDREIKRNRAAIPAGDYSVVKVVDHGIGISPDKVTKVFEPFYTTKRTGEGTGLGLSTAYGIVKQTGGFIFVESEPGQGTTFILYFPAHRPKEAPLPEIAKPQEQERGGQAEGVVLLVEDEAPVRAFASRALRLRGYTVLEAENAEEALDRLSDRDLEVDVFVTDVVMPGMDGPSWVTQALKERPDTRVVFVSGYAEDALADHKSRIPNSVFLPKPFSLNDLTRTVQAQFANRMH